MMLNRSPIRSAKFIPDDDSSEAEGNPGKGNEERRRQSSRAVRPLSGVGRSLGEARRVGAFGRMKER